MATYENQEDPKIQGVNTDLFNDTLENQETRDIEMTDREKDAKERDNDAYNPENFIKIRHIRRYKASILAECVPGNNVNQKLDAINSMIYKDDHFIGSKITYYNNKKYVIAIFGTKDAMLKHVRKSFLKIMTSHLAQF